MYLRIVDLLGVSYLDGGRDAAEGLDCLGLLLLLYRRLYDRELPDPMTLDASRVRSSPLSREFREVEGPPEPGDAVELPNSHVGFVLPGDAVIHCRREAGVIVTPIHRLRIKGVYRLRC